eukprot:10606180-Alexandrium_andersonii.AAC.1
MSASTSTLRRGHGQPQRRRAGAPRQPRAELGPRGSPAGSPQERTAEADEAPDVPARPAYAGAGPE